ncbi:hypothetical protein [Ciceribacter sp. L1K22]|uniref:hypothetical protein n=1 Tax=Ciceribacter sp. L1K22 TaxID=2820275 RepID=UPI001ABDA9EC|nr:hypothetical protein [Ciceribacter sp. L1K22]
MTDPYSQIPQRPEQSWLEPGKLNVQLVYGLYIASLVLGVSSIVGVVIAYINRGKLGGWVETHYTWAIRTSWIGLLYSLISLVLSFIVIGVLGFIATLVWFVVRVVIGLQKAGREEPISNPEGWIV